MMSLNLRQVTLCSRSETDDVWEESNEEYFGHKNKEVRGGWRKLHKVDIDNWYFSPDIGVI
jgi:hypothetical protein